MYSFNYVKARSVDDAAALILKHPDAKLLAGGMTLLPVLKQRLAQPSHLIDIGGLPELTGIAIQGERLVIGAAVKHGEVARSPMVARAIPALAYLADLIADPQVRNRGTLGGSVANNDPSADYPSAVLALDAVVVTNKREIPAQDFFLGMFATALEEGELITRISFRIAKRAAYEKFPHPASGYAMAGVFVSEFAEGVRVAVTGAGPGVFRWTEIENALKTHLSPDAAEQAGLDAEGLNEDFHATRHYRGQLVKTMTKRALAKLLGLK